MNIFGWVLLGALAVVAVTDWVAVARDSHSVEQLAKPSFVVLLIALAWLLHSEEVAHGQWLLVGLVLCLVGDVMLLRHDSERRFGLGLLAFLFAHLAYLAALVRMPHASPLWVGTGIVVLGAVLAFVFGLLPLLRRDLAAGVPPTAYALVLVSFASYAWVTGHLLLGIGASLFCVSDALIGWTRFVRDFAHSRLAVMVTYHLAQLLIAVGVLRPDLLALR